MQAHSRDKYLRKGNQSAPKASRSSSKASSFCTRAANGKTNDYQTDWRQPNNPKGGNRGNGGLPRGRVGTKHGLSRRKALEASRCWSDLNLAKAVFKPNVFFHGLNRLLVFVARRTWICEGYLSDFRFFFNWASDFVRIISNSLTLRLLYASFGFSDGERRY